MHCMTTFLVFDVLMMSTVLVLARPDRTMRSTKYILNLKSASSSTIPERKDKRAQAYISGGEIDGQHGGGIYIAGQKISSERVRSQDVVPQMTTRRDYGVRHSDPCHTKTQEFNLKTHFNTEDNFSPASHKKTVCIGAPGQRDYPTCVYGRLDCVTLYEDVSFIRMPSENCSTWYHGVINIPVGCQCMWPN